MAEKFLWGGLICIVGLGPLGVPFMLVVGSVLMAVGFVLLVLGK